MTSYNDLNRDNKMGKPTTQYAPSSTHLIQDSAGWDGLWRWLENSVLSRFLDKLYGARQKRFAHNSITIESLNHKWCFTCSMIYSISIILVTIVIAYLNLKPWLEWKEKEKLWKVKTHSFIDLKECVIKEVVKQKINKFDATFGHRVNLI